METISKKKSISIRAALFGLVLIIAIACIAVGTYKSWNSFRKFDEAILNEKDSQLYSLIRSDDVNLDTSIQSFVREAKIYFGRVRLKELMDEWRYTEYTYGLEEYINQNTLLSNPLYADVLIMNKGEVLVSATGKKDYSFLTEKDGNGLFVCQSDDGRYYLACDYDAGDDASYVALMDMEQLYDTALSQTSGRNLILMDRTASVLIRGESGKVVITPANASLEENTEKCRDYLVDLELDGGYGAISIEMKKDSGEPYTARMAAISSGETVNGVFSIGITADYDQTVIPSRKAARDILFYGGVAIAGILILIFMLLMLRRANSANAAELEILKKKNSAMEELNQNMLALSHHQRLETIGTMTASIAHDFNNLLTPIMGYSMMSMEMLPDDQTEIQENLMEVYNASVKAKDLVTRLADMSKKSKEENFVDLTPDEVIRSSLKVTLPAKPKNVEVRGSFKTGKVVMRGDRTQISQLVINIVLNAYDAMREKGGTLYVSTRVDDGRVVMRFKDTGSGMDAETVARIFDPFYTTKESGKGTGLGLAIVAQVVETHGGKVYVDSTPGEGTEFRISFPIIDADENFDKSKTRTIRTADIKAAVEEDD